MDILFILAYAVVYFVGYYGAYILNLAARRVLVTNLRVAGLGLVAIAAAVVAYLLQVNAPAGSTAFARGYVQGQVAIFPALVVGVVVGIRIWLENRKLGKPRKPVQ